LCRDYVHRLHEQCWLYCHLADIDDGSTGIHWRFGST
jgi:hypothetical protein